MWKLDTLQNPITAKPKPVNDFWEDIQNQAGGFINKNLESAEKQASTYANNRMKELFGNTGGGNNQTSQPPIRNYLERANNQPTPQQQGDNKIVETVKNVNPLVAGGVAMGVAYLFGLNLLTSAGIGAGVGAGKHFLIDNKQ